MKEKVKKFDQGKTDISLVSPILTNGLATVMSFGAGKYGRYNYLSGGMKVTRLVSALQRHLLAFLGKEDIDPESGQHHLFHVAANVQMLVDGIHLNNLDDDRFDYYGKE